MHPETVILLAAAVAAGAAATSCYLVRGSTAVPAAAWAVVAATVFLIESSCRAAGQLIEPAADATVRLVVAALAVCPTMSLLGAKRPQHGVWQFIVGTLACVLAMPAASAVLVRPGSMPDVHLLERCFFGLLLAVGWMNFVGTRHALAATLVTAGQAGLIQSFLPGGMTDRGSTAAGDAVAATAVAAGAALAVWQSARWPAGFKPQAGIGGAIDPPFLALRETLGAAWTLRIAERFNAVASERQWPCRLRFGGLVVEAGAGPEAWERDAIRCCRALLRRFVSEAWLNRRGGLRMPDGGSSASRTPHTLGRSTQR